MVDVKENEIVDLCMEHNFWTWSSQAHVNPIAVKEARGVYFWDTDGKKYLDFNSMVMCVNIGHGDSRVIEAMVKQARDLPFAGPGMATRPRAELGKLLAEITPPGMTKFLYTLGGADANENAIKLARGYTGKFKILTRYRSYHGATMGAMALTGDPRRQSWEPLTMPGVVHFLDPFRYRSTFHRRHVDVSEAEFSLDYLNHLEDVIRYEGAQTIAAILQESVTGTNGIIIPPAGYMQGVRDLCDRYQIVMINDEVMSGFGRTGKWFAVDHWNVAPDIITMAKGLTSGYAPLGAVGMKAEIAAAFNERPFEAGLTYNGHPVSLAAAIANIEVMQQDQLVKKAGETGQVLANMLAEMQTRHACIGEVRSIGLFGAMELVRDRKTREPMAPFNQSSSEMDIFKKEILAQGLFLYTHWNIVLIIPPLIITAEQLAEGFATLDHALLKLDAIISVKK